MPKIDEVMPKMKGVVRKKERKKRKKERDTNVEIGITMFNNINARIDISFCPTTKS